MKFQMCIRDRRRGQTEREKNNLQHIPVPVMAGRTADLSASDESSGDLRLVLS